MSKWGKALGFATEVVKVVGQLARPRGRRRKEVWADFRRRLAEKRRREERERKAEEREQEGGAP